MAKISKFLTEIFVYQGHLSTFRAEIQPKVGPLSSKLMPNHVLNKSKKNFEKAQNTTFLTPKMAKTRMSIRQKMLDFWIKFRFLSSNIALLGPRKKLKSFLLIGCDIQKKWKTNPKKILDTTFWTHKMAKTRMSI